MRYWVKALGSAGDPLPDDWRTIPELESSVMFARKPMIRRGDKIVYYAAGHRLVFAHGEVVSHPYQPATLPKGLEEYPWYVDVRLEYAEDYIRHGVPLSELSVGERMITASIRRRSHIQLIHAEYLAALDALVPQ